MWHVPPLSTLLNIINIIQSYIIIEPVELVVVKGFHSSLTAVTPFLFSTLRSAFKFFERTQVFWSIIILARGF